MKDFNLKGYLTNNKLLNENIGGMTGLQPLGKIDSLSSMSSKTADGGNDWISSIDSTPEVEGWKANWDSPGIIVWTHSQLGDGFVAATPGWDGPGTPVEFVSGQGRSHMLAILDKDKFDSFQDYVSTVKPYLDVALQNELEDNFSDES